MVAIDAIEILSESVGNKNGLSALKSFDRSDQEIESSAARTPENERSNLVGHEPSKEQPLSPAKPGSVQAPDTIEKPVSPKLANNSNARPDGPMVTRMMTPSLKSELVPTHLGFSTKPSNGKLKPGQTKSRGRAQPPAPAGVNGNGTKAGLKKRANKAPLPQYRYYVQIGSFLELEEAVKKREELKKSSYPAFIREANLGAKGNQYRVLVSSNHLDLERVTEEAKRLSKRLNLTTHIFKDK
jgi:cell division septation protein DedD